MSRGQAEGEGHRTRRGRGGLWKEWKEERDHVRDEETRRSGEEKASRQKGRRQRWRERVKIAPH